MRIENALLSQSLIESSKPLEKKEVTSDSARQNTLLEDSKSFIPSPLSSSGTYSVRSLKAAVDYHAKFLTVAESNLQAVQHSAMIPQVILDRLNGGH
jgi:hypothetical protein